MRPRQYVRCTGCLAVATVRTAPAFGWRCASCGCRVEFLGAVDERPVVGLAPARCGERCRLAIEPGCDCECGGRAHGADLEVIAHPEVHFPHAGRYLAGWHSFRHIRGQALRILERWAGQQELARPRARIADCLSAAERAATPAARARHLDAIFDVLAEPYGEKKD